MKKILTTFFSTLFFIAVAQKPASVSPERRVLQRPTLDPQCTIVNNGTPCNAITNNDFVPEFAPNTYEFNTDAFGYLYIPGWLPTHGTPQVSDGMANAGITISPMPPMASHYAFMAGGFLNTPNGPVSAGEGICQKIKPLNMQGNYVLSLYRKFRENGTSVPEMGRLRAVLMNCNDYASFNVNAGTQPFVPPLPANSQIIYNETNISGDVWQQVLICFTPIANYDMLWIYPEQTNTAYDLAGAGIEVAYPQIIDKADFKINVTALSSCNKQLSVNCTIPNAVYNWYLNGSTTPFSTSANPTVNTSTFTGTVTVTVGIAGSTCLLTASRFINPCSCDGNEPVITPGGPIDYYTPIDAASIGITLTSSASSGNQWYRNNQPISNATNNTLKIDWNLGFGSNVDGVYTVEVNGCKSNAVTHTSHYYGYGNYGEEIYYFGSKIHPASANTPNYFCYNTSNNHVIQFNLGSTANYYWNFENPIGLPQNVFLTPNSSDIHSNEAAIDINSTVSSLGYATRLQGVADINGRQKIIDFWLQFSHPDFISTNQGVCYNSNYYILNLAGSSLEKQPGNSGFDWEYYNFGSNGLIVAGPGAGGNSVTIPGRSAPQTMKVRFASGSGQGHVQKYFYYNGNFGGCYKEDYYVYPVSGCSMPVQNPKDSIKKQLVIIYPNPANTSVVLSAKEAIIQNVEIFGLFDPAIRIDNRYNAKSVSINVSRLKQGIYNCKITTNKGVEYQKLIINR